MRQSKNKKFDESKFWCIHCGSPEIGINYRRTSFGTAELTSVSREGSPTDYTEFETHNSDDWEITSYFCYACLKMGDKWKDVYTTDSTKVAELPNFSW